MMGVLCVWAYLTDPDAGADNRALIAGEALISIRDCTVGLCAGTLAALLAAVAFTIWPVVQRTLIGPSLALQTVPLIAITPLIVLIFGPGLLAVAVIGAIIASPRW